MKRPELAAADAFVADERPRLALVRPVVGLQAVALVEVPDRRVAVTGAPEVVGELEVGGARDTSERAGLRGGDRPRRASSRTGWRRRCVPSRGSRRDRCGGPDRLAGPRLVEISPAGPASAACLARSASTCHRSGTAAGRATPARAGGRSCPPRRSRSTLGMLTTPNNVSRRCVGSSSDGCSGAAASMNGREASGSLSSSETVTTSTPRGCSSVRSACHPGRSKRQPQYGAQATSSDLLAAQRRQVEVVAVEIGEHELGCRGGDECPPADRGGPQRPQPVLVVVDDCHPEAVGRPGEVEAVRPGASGTQTSPLHAPCGLISQPVPVVEGVGVDGERVEDHRRHPTAGARAGRP